MNKEPKKPRRLSRIFQSYDSPIYFITFNTHKRMDLLANEEVHERFNQFAGQAIEHSVAFGRYVIMPDHIHLFLRLAPEVRLGTTIRLLKRSLSTAINNQDRHWQPGYFDHLLRHHESYSEKWNYVVQNPVRAGLVKCSEEWPYQGEVIEIRY